MHPGRSGSRLVFLQAMWQREANTKYPSCIKWHWNERYRFKHTPPTPPNPFTCVCVSLSLSPSLPPSLPPMHHIPCVDACGSGMITFYTFIDRSSSRPPGWALSNSCSLIQLHYKDSIKFAACALGPRAPLHLTTTNKDFSPAPLFLQIRVDSVHRHLATGDEFDITELIVVVLVEISAVTSNNQQGELFPNLTGIEVACSLLEVKFLFSFFSVSNSSFEKINSFKLGFYFSETVIWPRT